MRRLVALLTITALAVTLMAPAVLFAQGKPAEGAERQAEKATDKAEEAAEKVAEKAERQAAKAAEKAEEAAEKAAEKAEEAAEEAAAKAERQAAKAAAKAERQAAKAARKAAERSIEETAGVRPIDEDRSSETTPALDASEPEAPAKATGIARALERILANIERAEARVAAGEQSAVPQGLLGVVAKFLGWLGVGADVPTPAPVSVDVPSEDETLTVEPPAVEPAPAP